MTIQFIANAPLPAALADDPRELRRFAAAVEGNGFDGLALDSHIVQQDLTALASYVLHSTKTLRVDVAHDAGVVPPQMAASQIATLDRLSAGRLTVSVTESGSRNHEERQAWLDEYLVLLKRLWSNDKPIDHEGRHHRLTGAVSAVKPYRNDHVPMALGGLSGLAIKVAARHADIFSLPAATVAATALTIERVRNTSARHRRGDSIRFSYPLRPVIGASRNEAWTRIGHGGTESRPLRSWNDASRLKSLAIDDGRPATDATLLAGTPEQVALAILDYHAIGVRDFVMHGLTRVEDIVSFGREVIPLVRNAVRHRDARGEDTTATLPIALRFFPWRVLS